MKKLNFNRVLFFILGGIFFSSITAYAATTILSKDVKFTPQNTAWDVENVEEAINSLYTKNNNMYLYKRVTSANGAKTINISDLKVNDYYLCSITARGNADKFNATNAEIIYERVNLGMLDYAYTHYLVYLKAKSDTINFSYTATNLPSAGYGMDVTCYKFGEK